MTDIEKSRISEIVTLHGEVCGLLKMSLEKAIRIGELLTEQKASLQHGDFIPWIQTNLPFTDRTARSYMNCYRNRDLLKTESISDLKGAYKLLGTSNEPAKQKSLLEQQQDLAEKKLWTEWEAGRAMNDMNVLLTPTEEISIVGTADEYIVFHIEYSQKANSYSLEVFNLSNHFKSREPGYTSKKFKINDKDFWWYLNEHVGIHKIMAIWQEPEIFLTDEELKRIDQAVEDNLLWDVVGQIVIERNQKNMEDSNFVESARNLYRNLMSAYDTLCDKYSLLMGTH